VTAAAAVLPAVDIKTLMASNLSAIKSDVVTPLPLPQNVATIMHTQTGLPQIPVEVSNTPTVSITELPTPGSVGDLSMNTNISQCDQESGPNGNNEVDSEDDEELQDGIIEEPMDTTYIPPKMTPPSDNIPGINSQEENITTDRDVIKLQQPGVQLTVFHYNILPVIGNTYKVNSEYHLEKVKYPPGNWYFSNPQGTLEKAKFSPTKLYQGNEDGILQQVQYLPYQVYQSNQDGSLLRPLDVISGHKDK
jgi:hypothetical protein